MGSLRITADEIKRALAGEPRPFSTGPIDISSARKAAVAVPISLSPEPAMHLVLRSSHLSDHAGEIAFPGGKQDPTDATLRDTAAREMLEEVGIDEARVTWLGELSPMAVITGRFVIHPFACVLDDGIVPRVVSSGEVEEVLRLPILPYVSGEVSVRAIAFEWDGKRVIAPHFPISGRILYGATAYIAYELLSRLAETLDQTLAPPVIETEAPWFGRYK